MPVVDTVQTFNTGDTVTSTTLNNIMDQSIFVAGAVVSGSGLAITAGGQMTTSGIPGANITDATISQAKLSSNVVGNGPAFFAFSASNQSLSNGVDTKVILASEDFDTNSNFAVSRFTPTIAGYYLICGSVGMADNATEFLTAKIFKNGSEFVAGTRIPGAANISAVSNIVYMNGTSDFVELYARHATGITKTIASGRNYTFMSGCLIRSA